MTARLYGVAYEDSSSRAFECRTLLAEEKEELRKRVSGRIISIVEIGSLAQSTAKCPKCKKYLKLGDLLCFGYRLKTATVAWIGEKSFYAVTERGDGDWYWPHDHNFVHVTCVDFARFKKLDEAVQTAVNALHLAMCE